MKIEYFVINLESDTAKKSATINELKKANISANFIKAINGSYIEKSVYMASRNKSIANIGRPLCRGEVGCAMSHLAAYQEIIRKNLDYGVIFEDDIHISKPNTFQYVIHDSLDNDIDIVLLGHHPRYSRLYCAARSKLKRKQKLRGELFTTGMFSEQPVGGYAYIISNSCAKKRIEEYVDITKPIDVWNTKRYSILGVFPSAVFVNYDFESNLDKERSFKPAPNNQLSRIKKLKNVVRIFLLLTHLYLPFERSKSFIKSFIVIKRPLI